MKFFSVAYWKSITREIQSHAKKRNILQVESVGARSRLEMSSRRKPLISSINNYLKNNFCLFLVLADFYGFGKVNMCAVAEVVGGAWIWMIFRNSVACRVGQSKGKWTWHWSRPEIANYFGRRNRLNNIHCMFILLTRVRKIFLSLASLRMFVYCKLHKVIN